MNVKLDKWYVLYVRSRQERKVHDLLIENEIESFLPLVKTVRKWSDRKKTIELPLFPSYVFVKINSLMDFHKTLSVEGSCAFIQFGKEYAWATEKEIQLIKLLIGEADFSDIKINEQIPQVGEKRMITTGALSGLECEVLKVDNVNKIVVRIESLKQNITATVPSYCFSTVLSA